MKETVPEADEILAVILAPVGNFDDRYEHAFRSHSVEAVRGAAGRKNVLRYRYAGKTEHSEWTFTVLMIYRGR